MIRFMIIYRTPYIFWWKLLLKMGIRERWLLMVGILRYAPVSPFLHFFRGRTPAWLFIVPAAPFLKLFFDTSPEPCFSNFEPRSLPKWSPNGHKIRRKLVPTAFQKNIHKTIRICFIFSLFSKRSMFQKHWKTHYRTMFFLELRPAQHLQTNAKKTIRTTHPNP